MHVVLHLVWLTQREVERGIALDLLRQGVVRVIDLVTYVCHLTITPWRNTFSFAILLHVKVFL
jgi:hypothetical protein